MSITSVRPYFRAHCKALGYKEHADAFNWENVAEQRANKVFHMEFGETVGQKMLQPGALESSTKLTLRLFHNLGRENSTGLDGVIAECETLIKRCLKTTNRLGSALKNVQLSSMTNQAMGESNDNRMISTLIFTASVLTDVEGA